MNTTDVFFSDSNFVGREVENVQDLVKALAAGMSIANVDGCGYYPYTEKEEEDEDGNVTYVDVEKTEDELFNEMKYDLEHNNPVYAGFYLNSTKWEVSPASHTHLRSSYYVGQDVYFLKDNRIVKGRIKYISLSQGDENKGYSTRIESVALELYKARPYVNDTTHLPTPWDRIYGERKQEFYNIAKKAVRNDFISVEYTKGKNTYEISLDFSEVWSHKQDVIDFITRDLD